MPELQEPEQHWPLSVQGLPFGSHGGGLPAAKAGVLMLSMTGTVQAIPATIAPFLSTSRREVRRGSS